MGTAGSLGMAVGGGRLVDTTAAMVAIMEDGDSTGLLAVSHQDRQRHLRGRKVFRHD